MTTDAELFLAQRDTGLWRGVYLGGLSSEEAAQHVLYEALRQAAERALDTEPQEAARLRKLLLEADPYDLRALRLTLRALAGDSRAAWARSTPRAAVSSPRSASACRTAGPPF